jgi:hypothetical protein
MFCGACGKQIEDADAFCRFCGAGKRATDLKGTKKSDPLFPVRIVLLIAAVISGFTAPWLITAFLVLVWLVVGFWPRRP